MSLLATAVYYFAFAKGTVLLPSSIAGLLSGAIPLFTFSCAWLFLREEHINITKAAGVALGFVGVLLIARPWSGAGAIDLAGVAYMMVGSMSVGCSFVYARKFISPLKLPAVALTTYQIGLAMVFLFLATSLDGMGAVFNDTRAWIGLIVGLGLCGTGLAYVIYYYIVENLGAVAAAGVTYIPPVVALFIGVLWAGDVIQPLGYLAMVLILSGVALLQYGSRQGCNPTRHLRRLASHHSGGLRQAMAKVTYEKHLTALLVIDPYNEFISEGGKIWARLKPVAEANGCVPHMLQVLNAARKAGVRVFYAMHHRYRPGDYESWKYIAPIQKAAWSSKAFEYGTWGGEIRSEFAPQPGDVVALEHWGSSGFANTDLDLQLKRHGIERLIVIGLIAHTCLEATVRFAAELGYDATVVRDATASYSDEHMHAALDINIPNYAAVVTTDQLVDALQS